MDIDKTKQLFDARMAAGDYSGAYAVANAGGFNNNEIAGYVNQKYGASLTPEQVGSYQSWNQPTTPITPTLPVTASNGNYDYADLRNITGIDDLNAYRLNSVPASVYQAAAPASISSMQDARNAYWQSPEMTVGHMASPTWNANVLQASEQQGVIDPKTGLRFVRSNEDGNYRVMNRYGASVDNFTGLTGAADQEFVNRGYSPEVLSRLRAGDYDKNLFDSTDPLQSMLQDFRAGTGQFAPKTPSGASNPAGAYQPMQGSGGSVGGAGGASLGLGNGSFDMPGYMGIPTVEAPINNPYLQSQIGNYMELQNRNLQQNMLPAIRSGAVGAGQYGSSRQGVAEGIAMQNADLNNRNAISNLLGSAYETAQNRQLAANTANAGNYGNLYQFNQGLARNVFNDNMGRQMQGVNLGMQAYGVGNQAIQSGMNVGNQMYQRPWQTLQAATGVVSPLAGMGGTSTTSMNNPSNPYASALGGAAAGYGLYSQFNQQQPSQTFQPQNTYQSTTVPGYESTDLGLGIRM